MRNFVWREWFDCFPKFLLSSIKLRSKLERYCCFALQTSTTHKLSCFQYSFLDCSFCPSEICSLTLLKMGLQGWGVEKRLPLPKICHTYPAIMKLGTVIPYLKKNINHVTQPLSSNDISIFSPEISKFCYIK